MLNYTILPFLLCIQANLGQALFSEIDHDTGFCRNFQPIMLVFWDLPLIELKSKTF
jgi:hypothetical protein